MKSDEPAVTLSGPLTARGQVRKILQQHGFDEADDQNPTQLPDTTTGESDKTVGFLTVYGDDLQTLGEVLQSTGWDIRGHWQGMAVTHPLLVDVPPAEPDEVKVRAIVEQILKEKGN